MRVSSGVCLALFLGGASIPALAADTILKPESGSFRFTDDLKGKKGEAANDVSGIACLPEKAGKRRCLSVDDESRAVQFLTVDGGTIEPGKTIDLIGRELDPATLGTLPTDLRCPSEKAAEFKEFDGEGVAYAAPYFYVVGSHGCGRNKDRLRTSSLILARLRVDADGKPEGKRNAAVETSYRLGDVLAASETVKAFFLKSLMQGNGLNVEGIAVVGDRLYAGLRAPSIDGKAFLVEAELGALFAPGHEAYRGRTRTIAVPVGERAGIRDLAALEDGRLLLLTGPAQEQTGVAYRLFLFDPTTGGEPQALGALEALDGPDRGGKAEAVTGLGRDRVLVLFDSLRNGGPRSYRVPAALTSGP